jgi:hypothetical protein
MNANGQPLLPQPAANPLRTWLPTELAIPASCLVVLDLLGFLDAIQIYTFPGAVHWHFILQLVINIFGYLLLYKLWTLLDPGCPLVGMLQGIHIVFVLTTVGIAAYNEVGYRDQRDFCRVIGYLSSLAEEIVLIEFVHTTALARPAAAPAAVVNPVGLNNAAFERGWLIALWYLCELSTIFLRAGLDTPPATTM